jgi:hypothetical protein
MSVLSFPRIYFKGFIGWDPCTFNNNDWQAFPTYDATNAALNWSFLASEGPQPGGITPANFASTFRPWAITLQDDKVDNPTGKRIPAEWNMFGTHTAAFVQYNDKTTTIIGGDLGYGQRVTQDPLIGTPVNIGGDNSTSGNFTPARLVDTNPISFWSSQVYWSLLQCGSGNFNISGSRSCRMFSRWINLNRIYSATPELTQPAAAVAACFQTCIPNDQITWTNRSDPSTGASSQLLTALQRAATQSGAQGVMMRFTAYVNLYFQNGIFNGTSQRPRTYADLAACLADAWQAFEKNGDTSLFFSHPCYSHVVGVIGVWNQGELASVPGGRYFAAQNKVTPIGPPVKLGHAVHAATLRPSVALGPVVANVDYKQNLISLDLNSTIPENAISGTVASDLTKIDLGPLTLGVQADGAFYPVAQIAYDQYGRPAYEARAGIVDVPFSPTSDLIQKLQDGVLAIQVQGQTALAEQGGGFTAQTNTRGIYLDENQGTEFQIAVQRSGAPAAGAQVLIAKYDSNLSLIPSSQPQLVNFTNGRQQTIQVPNPSGDPITTEVTVVPASDSGDATAGIMAQSPGFPVLAFFPFAAGQPLPQPPVALLGPATPLNQVVSNAFYTTVRVLPFDSQVPDEFINLWNTTHDPVQAWNFIYNQILYVYDMLFSVMLEYVNLGDRTAVEQNIQAILKQTSAAYAAESTLAMPITRDLSAGKRVTLQLWGYLVQHGYNVPALTRASANANAAKA